MVSSIHRFVATLAGAMLSASAAAAEAPRGDTRVDAEAGPGTALVFRVGPDGAQVRDRQPSPLRYGGWGVRVGVGVDDSDIRWRDRLDFTWRTGTLSNDHGAELSRTGWAVDWLLERRVLAVGEGGLSVGGRWHTLFERRDGAVESFDLRSVLEAAVGYRHVLRFGEHRLWLEGGLSTPLIGAALRPGYGSPLVGRSLELGDAIFVGPHNLQGVAVESTALWRRPGGADLRATVAWRFERLTPPHVVERVDLVAELAWLWRW